MKLHRSNRMEALAGALADLMRAEPGEPCAPERIVVPHPTIERWLSLELARALGIATNLRFELPAEFAWSIMRDAAPGLPREQMYAPARLRWRIRDVLPEWAEGPEGRTVRGYLGDGDPRKRFELADRLARVFDRCLLYRPDWIREWERGAAPHWQARLWRRLSEDGPGAGEGRPAGEEPPAGRSRTPAEGWSAGGTRADGADRAATQTRASAEDSAAEESGTAAPHWVAAIDAFHERFAAGVRPSGWPGRAVFFGVSSFSPSYLEVLRRAGEGIEIHLFMLAPCREYWGDIRSRREIGRRAGSADPADGYFTEGNELLAAWGRAGRETFDALVESEVEGEEDHFAPPDGLHRLAAVQRDILDLRLASEAAETEAAPVGLPCAGAAGGSAPEETTAAPPPVATSPENPSSARPLLESGSEDTPTAGAPAAASLAAVPPADVPPAGRLERRPAPPADDSIQIHVCHSPMREAEVLHDRLLALFDAHDDLEPADVLVLTPSLDVYGPAVEAVLGAAGRIPCHVAHARGGESRTLRAFLDLLALPRSRHGAEPMLAPLAAPAVRARFGIGESDLPAVRALVREAGIRWGVDEAHRGREGLPETAGHTWRQGLRRLLLGYAMEGTDALVAGIVPCSADAPGFGAGEVDGEFLGRFVSYCEEVFGLRDRLCGERRPARWAALLRAVVRDFFSDGGRSPAGGLADEVGAVRALIRDFEREAQYAESPAPIEVVLDVLRERAGDTRREPARLADGVTVASLGPGRIFPAGIVCVAGMNDGAFPRLDPTPSFDLVAAGPARRGDRDVRHEDRFAFLEALLAARRCFLVTYTGRGPRDDAPIPPSVLVDELKDYLRRRFPGAPVETRHPLQPFSPRYFVAGAGEPGRTAGRAAGGAGQEAVCETANETDSDTAGRTSGYGPEEGQAAEDLFSYSRGMCEAAKAMRGRGKVADPPERFAVALSEPEESRRCVALADLVAFFANPVRFFLRDRLGARLEAGDAALDDEEPFEIEGLERYRLRSGIWEQVRAGTAPERSAALLQGSGRLPHAGLGLVVHEREREEAEQLERQLARYRAALEAPPRDVDFELGGFRVVGAIEHVEPEGGGPEGDGPGTTGPDRMVWWRIGRLRARDRIEIGLRQLAWASAGHEPMEAVAISSERGSWTTTTFPPPERAREQFERWLRAWWRGLAAPLPFFPETSLAYAKAVVRAGSDGSVAVESARAKACDAWLGSRYQRGERLDPCLGLVYDGPDPLEGEFEDLAEALLVPLIAGSGR